MQCHLGKCLLGIRILNNKPAYARDFGKREPLFALFGQAGLAALEMDSAAPGLASRSNSSGGRSQKRGCGTTDYHRLWLNKDPCGLVTGSMVWVLTALCWAGVSVRKQKELASSCGLFCVWLCVHAGSSLFASSPRSAAVRCNPAVARVYKLGWLSFGTNVFVFHGDGNRLSFER